ncbi:MAG: ZIP family metal transporter [Flavobacteriales bacterium]|nr:ZIP family metal transporter [Flavobacteriales bacterium]
MNQLFVIHIILITAALAGSLSVLAFKLKFSANLKIINSFSGSFLLAICVLHLIPEIYTNYSSQVGIFILLGFLLQLLLEFFSEGIEHGHFHAHNHHLAAFPYAVFMSLCIHSFIEGMALTDNEHAEYSHFPLLLGIVIHKIPIAIVLSSMLLTKNIHRSLYFVAIVIFALSAPLGLLVASSHILPFVENETIFLAFAVGIFLHISTTILFETADNHKFNLKKFLVVILGFLIAMLTVQ